MITWPDSSETYSDTLSLYLMHYLYLRLIALFAALKAADFEASLAERQSEADLAFETS